ncbi:hypothetical protein LOK49_Contig379G00003 [Camellia lanceoleosa]|nr:hypothetical protein LOK49_Contig379G00003 [Camellia lanceoleosa]
MVQILMNEIHYVKPVATEAVQLTAKSHYSGKSKEEVTAVKIQTAFRGYLRAVTITPSTAHQLIQNINDTICIALADDTCDQPKIRMNNVVITPSFKHS